MKDWVAFATMLVTALGSLATAGMAYLTWKNISLLTRQTGSQAQGAIFDAHRDLYLEILGNDDLCSIVSDDNMHDYRRNMLGSLLINHCARIFSDYQAQFVHAAAFDEFKRDATDLFNIPIVARRWPEIRDFHSERFRIFIDTMVLHDSLADQVSGG